MAHNSRTCTFTAIVRHLPDPTHVPYELWCCCRIVQSNVFQTCREELGPKLASIPSNKCYFPRHVCATSSSTSKKELGRNQQRVPCSGALQKVWCIHRCCGSFSKPRSIVVCPVQLLERRDLVDFQTSDVLAQHVEHGRATFSLPTIPTFRAEDAKSVTMFVPRYRLESLELNNVAIRFVCRRPLRDSDRPDGPAPVCW